MYDIPAGLIVLGLLIGIVAALEAGYRIGILRKERTDEKTREHIHITETSTLGLLALLLAFSFSSALNRYDSRSDQVVDEANAIGTAFLRIELLRPELRVEARRLMRDYLDLRVKGATVPTSEGEEWRAIVDRADDLHAALWALGAEAMRLDPNVATSGLFVQALNEMFDSFGRRDAGLNRHVPEAVLLLLYLVFLIAAAIVGYASGTSGNRPPAVSLVMVVLIVLLIYVILDFDRPRRGLIQVPKQPFYDLQAVVYKSAGRGPHSPAAAPTAPASAASR